MKITTAKEGCGCPYHPRKSRVWFHCRDCGRKKRDCGIISARGLCMDCACKRQEEIARGMVDPSSAVYARWREVMLELLS